MFGEEDYSKPTEGLHDSTVDRVLALYVLKAGLIPIPFRVPKALTLAPKQNKSKLIELYILLGFGPYLVVQRGHSWLCAQRGIWSQGEPSAVAGTARTQVNLNAKAKSLTPELYLFLKGELYCGQTNLSCSSIAHTNLKYSLARCSRSDSLPLKQVSQPYSTTDGSKF